MAKTEKPQPGPRDQITTTLLAKSAMKQDVYRLTYDQLSNMKEALQAIAADLEKYVSGKDPRLVFTFTDKG